MSCHVVYCLLLGKAGATIVPIKVSEVHSFNLVLSSTNPQNESARQMLLTKNAERIDAPSEKLIVTHTNV